MSTRPDLEHMRRWIGLRRQRRDDAVMRGEELQAGERGAEGRDIGAEHGEFEVLVLARLPSVPEVERPAADDAPWPVDAGEATCEFGRMPGAPGVVVRDGRHWRMPTARR
jgi:hypothetical protein